ncbi:MAG: signal peptide peptidase SppA [Oscillatoriaceae bacterium SKW80]|nr:signal peptide peptidase SppA [Oscillatoriaceae bacterium SKYG93]MCX8120736.1 signal peptide peptidase SppA [Oscillatoriaceae bacterium SKW80]MDW8453726.1 signal peptide peptidase SppA [Oscillatoriaceae cyanobacterium SKYGB_i_bin93]HIK26958.1 signal peptide peptidase SppA [Oscillatoriaceae cyanobacterium M7585_C2015_266]
MRDFLKYTFASLVGSLLGLVLLSTLGIVGLMSIIIAATFSDSSPKVEDKSVLVYDLSLKITDSKPISTTGEVIQQALFDEAGESITLREVLNALDKATKDSRIAAIFLQGSTSDTKNGFATLKEVRSALERFRKAGKTIIAYDQDWTEEEYFLGSVANTVVVNPLGQVEINGFSSQTMFLTGALQKYGIGVQVVRVGKYKSAVEPFERTKLSPENKQQIEKMLGDLWGEFRTSVGKYRQLSPQQVQAIADSQGILMAQQARARRLVDKVAYFDELIAELKKLSGKDDKENFFRQISLPAYIKVSEANIKSSRNSKNRIAVLYAEGNIVDGEGGSTDVGGERLAKELRKLRLDKNIKAVVLRVNSPGGSATASEVIQREVKLTREAKPVVVSMGNYAASGGYWISTYGNRIFAESTTITGSIGVFGLLPNVQQLANNNGITWDVVKTGRYADAETVFRPKTEQEIAIYRQFVEKIYEQFLNKVAESRNLPKENVAAIAQGRIWSGIEAKKIGLVDEIGGLQDAIQAAAKLANLQDNWEIDEYPKSRSIEERILQKLLGAKASRNHRRLDPLTAQWQLLQQELAALQTFNDPKGVYARLPFNFRID